MDRHFMLRFWSGTGSLNFTRIQFKTKRFRVCGKLKNIKYHYKQITTENMNEKETMRKTFPVQM
jgi:hypothetical protein